MAHEKFKLLPEVTSPDVRCNLFGHVDPSSGNWSGLKLEEFYAAANGIRLSDTLPDNVHFHFQNARHLIIYSWFYYPFNTVAMLHGYMGAEAALRTHYNDSGKTSFKNLLTKAVAEGKITESGFTHLPTLNPITNGYESWTDEIRFVKTYTDVVVETIPYLRNEMAHGAHLLFLGSERSIQMCADIANQLFETKPSC